MAHNVETMAYAGTVPWHGLGNPVSNDLTPAQMLKAAKLDWKVEKKPIFIQPNGDGTLVEVKNEFALVRDSDHRVLSMVGSTYKPVQNDVALDFFRKFIEAGHMQMETAGSLCDGKYIWALARVGSDFTLGKKDTVQNYVLLMSPHVFGKALVAQFTPIRVVCWNTLNFALGSGLKGNKHAFRMPHSMSFNDSVRAKAEEVLGIAVSQSKEFKEAAGLLAKKKLDDADAFFFEVLEFDPRDIGKLDADGKKKREPLLVPKFRDALAHSPGAELSTARGTLWGALNAVTYVIDHEIGRDRGTALKTAWFGNKANVKRRALDIALKKAK